MEKALEILKEYKNIDYGCDMSDHKELCEEAITELEELMKPKSCDDCMFDYCGCSVQDSILRADNTATFETFCCNRFKQKDNT